MESELDICKATSAQSEAKVSHSVEQTAVLNGLLSSLVNHSVEQTAVLTGLLSSLVLFRLNP